jgi:hypothetical protein
MCTAETKIRSKVLAVARSALECVRFSAALEERRIVHFISPVTAAARTPSYVNASIRAKAALKRTHSKALARNGLFTRNVQTENQNPKLVCEDSFASRASVRDDSAPVQGVKVPPRFGGRLRGERRGAGLAFRGFVAGFETRVERVAVHNENDFHVRPGHRERDRRRARRGDLVIERRNAFPAARTF